jgi:hypothetical protein
MATLDGRPLPGRPRSRDEAWARWYEQFAHRVHPMVLRRARIAFEREEWPRNRGNYPDKAAPLPPATSAETRAAIDECLAKTGRPIGEKCLWPMVREELELSGRRANRTRFRGLALKLKPGRRPSKGIAPKS